MGANLRVTARAISPPSEPLSLVGDGPLSVRSFSWKRTSGEEVCTVIVKVTYEIVPGECAIAAPDPIQEADQHWDDASSSVRTPSDFVPMKVAPEVTLSGSAFSAGGRATARMTPRLVVQSVDKSLEVWAPRQFSPTGDLLVGVPRATFPLAFEHAGGGPSTDNPLGPEPGVDDDIPSMQPLGFAWRGPTTHVPTVTFAPYPASWPVRRSLLRVEDETWLAAPHILPMPRNFDARYFQAAPVDQRMDEPIAADCRVLLEGLHPDVERLVTNLPGFEPLIVVFDPQDDVKRMRADTMHIDTDRRSMTVTWRHEITVVPGVCIRGVVTLRRSTETLYFPDVKKLRELHMLRAESRRVPDPFEETRSEMMFDRQGPALPFVDAPPSMRGGGAHPPGVLPFGGAPPGPTSQRSAPPPPPRKARTVPIGASVKPLPLVARVDPDDLQDPETAPGYGSSDDDIARLHAAVHSPPSPPAIAPASRPIPAPTRLSAAPPPPALGPPASMRPASIPPPPPTVAQTPPTALPPQGSPVQAPAQVQPTQVPPAQVQPAQVPPAQVPPAQVPPAQVQPAQVQPAPVSQSQVSQPQSVGPSSLSGSFSSPLKASSPSGPPPSLLESPKKKDAGDAFAKAFGGAGSLKRPSPGPASVAPSSTGLVPPRSIDAPSSHSSSANNMSHQPPPPPPPPVGAPSYLVTSSSHDASGQGYAQRSHIPAAPASSAGHLAPPSHARDPAGRSARDLSDDAALAQRSMSPRIRNEESELPARRAVVDLLFFQPEIVARIDRDPYWRERAPAAQPLRRPNEASRDKEASADQDRLRLLKLMSCVEPITSGDLRYAFEERLSTSATFELPLLIVEGDLQPSFDEVETLKLMLAATQPLATTDKKLGGLVKVATEMLASTWPPTGEAALGLARQLEQAAKELALPPRYLTQQVDRALLEARHFKRRDVFGGPHLRADLLISRSDGHVPIYADEAIVPKLPLLQSIRVIALGELRPQEDSGESYPDSFLALAVARRVDVRRR